MQFVDLIGIEKEFWLLDLQGQLREPKTYGFPFDEFGFLVELRTKPHITEQLLIEDFNNQLEKLQSKALLLDCVLSDEPRRLIDKLFIKDLSVRYQYSKLKDLTANVYAGTKKSHATGIDGDYGTAGVHVHFSRHIKTRNDYVRIQLPIFEIVTQMDIAFAEIIQKAERNFGEFEIKPYGFEYRSLPANAPIEEIIKKTFEILQNVKK